MAYAAVLTLLAGLAILILIPLTLITLFVGFPIPQGRLSPILEMLAVLWFPVGLVVSFRNAVVGLEVVNDPSWQGVAILSLLTGALVFTSPGYWWLN
jgi:hypothetical protein